METTYRVQVTPSQHHITPKFRNQDFAAFNRAADYFYLLCQELDAENVPEWETLHNQQTNWLCDARDYIITLEIIFS